MLEYEVIRKFIKEDGKLFIDTDDWTELKNIYTKNELLEVMATLISCGEVKFPYLDIEYDEVINKFKELTQLETSIKEGDIFSRYDDKMGKYYFDESASFNVISNYFHQESRMKAGSNAHKSPIEVWKNFKIIKTCLKPLVLQDISKVSSGSLLSCIALKSYIASQFKPSVAKAIYDYYNAENVIDLCSGWGDRLAGFYTSKSGKTYFGIDPNTNLVEGYKKQIECYKTMSDKEAVMNCACAEDENLKFPDADFIFTSPPYFCTEEYSNDYGQSWVKYQKLQLWLDKFLFKIILKSFNALKKGGHLVLNISDVYIKGSIQPICTPMIEYAKSIGFKYVDTYGMRMSKRMWCGAQGDGVFCEPIYIFEK